MALMDSNLNVNPAGDPPNVDDIHAVPSKSSVVSTTPNDRISSESTEAAKTDQIVSNAKENNRSSQSRPDLFTILRVWFGVFLLTISAYFGSLFLQAPLLPLAFIWPRLFRWALDKTMSLWLRLAETITVSLFGVRVRHFGDPILRTKYVQSDSTICDRNMVVLLNHRTQLDWFFAWALGDAVQQLKIVLKESLAQLPGYGWAMQSAAFIFLRRRISTDEVRLSQMINYLTKTKGCCQLLIFPEGTDLNAVSMQKSDRFADKNGLQRLKYTLHPRKTGFVYVLKQMFPNQLDDLYDVTVAYPDFLPSPEGQLIRGHMPKEVHYYVRRFTANDIWPSARKPKADQLLEGPADANAGLPTDEQLGEWLEKLWYEKEQLLEQYYAAPINQRRFQATEITPASYILQPDQTGRLHYSWLSILNTVIWFVVIVCGCFAIITSWLVLIYLVLAQIVFIYLTVKCEGVGPCVANFAGVRTTSEKFQQPSEVCDTVVAQSEHMLRVRHAKGE